MNQKDIFSSQMTIPSISRIPVEGIPQNPKNLGSIYSIESIKYYESKNYHPLKTTLFILTIIISVFYNFIKGSTTIDSIFGFDKCDAGQFVVMGCVVIIIGAILVISIITVYKEQKIKTEHNYLYDHEFKFTTPKITFLVFYGFGTGFFAYILGMGGGLFLVPMAVFFLKHSIL